MLKMLGSHTKNDGPTMAVLECGHEVAYNLVKWVPAGDTLVGMAVCPKKCEAPKPAETVVHPLETLKAPDHSEQ